MVMYQLNYLCVKNAELLLPEKVVSPCHHSPRLQETYINNVNNPDFINIVNSFICY